MLNDYLKKEALGSIRPKIRCAIYTRRSIEEGLETRFSSLDAQHEACEKYIQLQKHEGWEAISYKYSDNGFTGGNMLRPGLQQLLCDIKANLIDTIVVYKLDRLSRSLRDFLNISHICESSNITIVSITQQFNSTSSIGKFILNVLMTFAEFEHKIISERIRDKMAASKRKGIWMGGKPPLGYDLKEKKIVVNEQEAITIHFIFQQFLKNKSLKSIADELGKQGIRRKLYTTKKGRNLGDKDFGSRNVYNIIINPLYIGKIRYKNQLYDGRHSPIIAEEVWEQANQKLVFNGNSSQRKVPEILLGLIKCWACGKHLTTGSNVCSKTNKIFRRYVTSSGRKEKCKFCCSASINASFIEALVLKQLEDLLKSPELIIETWKDSTQNNCYKTEKIIRESLSGELPNLKELSNLEQKHLMNIAFKTIVMQPEAVELRIKADCLPLVIEELNKHKLKQVSLIKH